MLYIAFMKDLVMKVAAKIVMMAGLVLIYGAMLWLAINPVVEYFEAKEVGFGQSVALVFLILIIVDFIKEQL